MARAALFALILVSAAAGVAANLAQDEPTPQKREGGQNMRQQQMGPPGSMVVCKDHIFILQGPKLIKVDPTEMKIVAELEVFKPKDGMKNEQPRDPNK